MSEELTQEEVKQILADLEAAKQQEKPSKYRNKRTTVDGITFASRKEAKWYGKLKALERSGVIKNLQLQRPWKIKVGGILICTYIADFQWEDVEKGCLEVADAKGFPTPVFKLKKKLMLAVHEIEIKVL